MAVRKKYLLIAILLLAAIFRFYNFTQANVITDEALNAIRSIGLVDFDASPYQTSPWQWVDQVPSWMHLAMHDQPILNYLISHWSLEIFGNNLWGLRLPFILAGILAVYLIYLIGKKLFDEPTALLAGLILSLTTYHVWISRLGLQESIVISLGLASFYYCLRTIKEPKQILPTLIWLGLCLMAKYTGLILVPIFVVILIKNKLLGRLMRERYVWLGVLALLIIILPSLIYNYQLQTNFGHLDFQLSQLFHQTNSHWVEHLGRELSGNFSQRTGGILANLKDGTSWPLFLIFVFSYCALAVAWWLKRRQQTEQNNSIFILLASLTSYGWWLGVIGSAHRFTAYVIPLLALSSAWLIISWYKKFKDNQIGKSLIIALLIGVIGFEAFFGINTLLLKQPLGPRDITWGRFYYDNKDWGLNQLDKYLDDLLKNKRPYLSLPPRYGFLEQIKNEATKQAQNRQLTSLSVLIIYDPTIDDLAQLWLFHRRIIYQSWPILDAVTYLQAIKDNGPEFFKQSGVEQFYFIRATEQTLLDKNPEWSKATEQLENELIKKEALREDVWVGDQVVFRVYKF